MPNVIKYSSNPESRSLVTGDFLLGPSNLVGYGPTSSTDYWNGISPPSGGYTIYINKDDDKGPSIIVAASDAELINIASGQSGTSVSTIADALDYFFTQADKIVVNRDYESIVTDGLVFCVDAGFSVSYPQKNSTWRDISESRNDATLVNTPTYNSSGFLTFSDTGSEYVTATNLGDLSNWTVEAWVKFSKSLSGKVSSVICNQFDLSSKLNFTIGTNRAPTSYNICVGFYDGAWRTTNGFAPSLDTWYHIAGTYDGTTITQYVNGSSNTTLNYTGTSQSGGEIRLMRRWDGTVTSGNLVDGDLGIARIYDRALSAAEILQNYNAQSARFVIPTIVTDNLVMQLDASDTDSYSGSGTTWTDISGNGNDGTISGASWSSTDGGIFDFDGINDSVLIADTADLRLNTSQQKTIQVWVKFDTLPALNTQVPVFGKLSSSFGFDGYWGGLFSNGGVVRCVTNGTSVQRISNSTLTVSTNTWYLLTFISQITSTANTTKVYINETEYITAAHGADSINETNPLYLGFIGSGVSSNYLNGKIGACFFYTKGLSESEISENFEVTKGRFGL